MYSRNGESVKYKILPLASGMPDRSAGEIAGNQRLENL